MSEMVIRFPGGLRVDAEFDGMVIPTDQSSYAGGESSAPTPFALFLASLGTCAGIYVHGFCQQRGIPTDQIHIVQRMIRNPEERRIERIEMEIRLPPEFPDKYRKAVVNAANLCAVKKHLERPPDFEVTAVKDGD